MRGETMEMKQPSKDQDASSTKRIRIIYDYPYAIDCSSEDDADYNVKKNRSVSKKPVVSEIFVGDAQCEFSAKTSFNCNKYGAKFGNFEDVDGCEKSQRCITKYKGVRWRKNGTFAAEIQDPFLKTKVWLGTFKTADEANMAYQTKRVEFDNRRSLQKTKSNLENLQPSNKAKGKRETKRKYKHNLLSEESRDLSDDAATEIVSLSGNTSATKSGNCMDVDDRVKIQRCVTRYEGAHRRKNGKYASEIRDPFTKTRVWLGTFKTAEQASMAYHREKVKFDRRRLLQKTESTLKKSQQSKKAKVECETKSDCEDNLLSEESRDISADPAVVSVSCKDTKSVISHPSSASVRDIFRAPLDIGLRKSDEQSTLEVSGQEASVPPDVQEEQWYLKVSERPTPLPAVQLDTGFVDDYMLECLDQYFVGMTDIVDYPACDDFNGTLPSCCGEANVRFL